MSTCRTKKKVWKQVTLRFTDHVWQDLEREANCSGMPLRRMLNFWIGLTLADRKAQSKRKPVQTARKMSEVTV